MRKRRRRAATVRTGSAILAHSWTATDKMSVFAVATSSLSVCRSEAVLDFTHKGELKPGQVGAARFLLGWSQLDLAKAAGLARTTVVSFENASRAMLPSVRDTLRSTLEDAGIEFVYAKDGSYGVVLAKRRLDAHHRGLAAKNGGNERRR